MQIGDILDRGAIALRVGATDKRQILAHIAEVAARNFGLDAGAVLDGLSEREAAGSTGIGQGVAVPHARMEGLDRIRGVFLRVEQPVEFDSIDEQPADLIFALLAPAEAGTEHLRALARVSRMLRNPELRQHLRAAPTPDALHALLLQEAAPSAA